MCKAAKHTSHAASHASHGGRHARHKVIVRTIEINRNNFILNFRLGNLDLDFEIRIADFAIKKIINQT